MRGIMSQINYTFENKITQLVQRNAEIDKMIIDGLLNISETIGNTFYVSNDGNDANDGYTQATALATIGKALNKVSRSCRHVTVYLAGGTYDENVILHNSFVQFDLQGDVTITGDLDLRMESVVSVISSNNAKFTADYIRSFALSRLVFNSCSVEATSIIAQTGSLITLLDTVNSCTLHPGDAISAIHAASNAIIDNSARVTSIVGANAASVCSANGSGLIYWSSPTATITGSFTGAIFFALNNSYMSVSGNNISSTASISQGINCQYGSYVVIGVTITVSNCTGQLAYVYANSIVQIGSSITFTRSGSTAVGMIYAGRHSTFTYGAATLRISASNCTNFFNADPQGLIEFGGNATLILNGSVTASTANVARNGVITIPTTTSISGTVTGKRYAATSGGIINVGGAGANRIPGSIAGTTNSSAFGFYG